MDSSLVSKKASNEAIVRDENIGNAIEHQKKMRKCSFLKKKINLNGSLSGDIGDTNRTISI